MGELKGLADFVHNLRVEHFDILLEDSAGEEYQEQIPFHLNYSLTLVLIRGWGFGT